MSQITIRKIPENLDKQLRTLARTQNISLNKIVIQLLQKVMGITGNKQRDLSDIVGTWDKAQCEEFEKNTQVFNEIDNEIRESLTG